MKMQNLFFLCLTILLSSNLMSAQTDEISGISKLNIHFEAATAIVVNSISVKLEGQLFSSDSEKIHLYGRAGFGYMDVSNLIFCDDRNAWGGLLGLTMLTGKGNHHFEANCGGFLGSAKRKNNHSDFTDLCDDSDFKLLPLIDVGYRFQKPEGGFIFRANIGLIRGLGIGVGHAF